MKKYLSIIAAALLMGSFSSCSDFLDRYPLEELSDESFWKTEKDAEMAVSNLYNVLPTWDTDEAINSDDAVHGIKWAAGNQSKGVYDPSDYGWSGEYGYIRQANLILEKIQEMDLSEDAYKKLEGQARFFRAYTYFTLIRSFGAVPYIDKPLELTDVENITRTPKDEVYAKVMEDFDIAIANLPVQWDDANSGRITKGAAMAMKARAALYYNNWETAMTEAKKVMDLGQYELYDKDNTGRYKELFWEVADGCDEFILSVQFNAPTRTHYLIGWECFPTLGWGGLNPTQSLVDAFEDINGAPIANSTIYDSTNPFANRDPRLEVNVLHDGETMYGVTIKVAPLSSSGNTGIGQHGDATATGYYQQKWLDPSIDPQSTGWDMGKDWVVIRYAEVLLTYAEAKNELSPLDPSAFDAVNQVRRRVGMPDLQNTDPTKPTYCGTQDDLRKRIWNEWRVEFALEGGKRQWDIRRWGIAKDVLNAPFEGLRYTLVDDPNAPKGDNGKKCILYVGEPLKLAGSHYEDHNYLLPIPQTEIDLNPKLEQNPGY
ncbi:RagB/SusD family nutrient uptake outer membrane protein [Phocaeicola coprophilus]|uniref:RagB/SusD family nutrient uptake outer membrane protein n=1 Tax=Phocaeicola coprophilus TaxID=387090 RepID=UPI001D47AFCF|nr:RagB/SusD family nutrient uptake outer membrane protein [Phocaeicola coprophilus]HJE46277.1 RagB/SusD family nutrient uptake outer membrane protein [Phocaeicola coprophilus]